MSIIQAIYISDINDNLIYEYLSTLSSPSFKSLLSTIESYKNSSISIITLNNISVYFHNTKNLVFYILCSTQNASADSKSFQSANPLNTFVFLNRLIEVMSNYFGNPLTASKIEANYDILTLIINEMVDNGIPYITDFNKLRDLIPMKNLLSNLFNNSSSSALSELIKPETPSIPWRRSNVKYTNNELFVDIIETLNVVLSPKVSKNSKFKHFDSAFYSSSSSNTSNMIAKIARIDGDVQFTSHLSGIPDLQMILNTGILNIGIPTFHQCVKIERWLDNPGTLSFIPPDGTFQLMSYSLDLNESVNAKNLENYLGLVSVDFQNNLGSKSNEFEVRLFTKMSKSTPKIDYMKVLIQCDGNISNIKSLRSTHGDFIFKGNGLGEWVMRNISMGVTPTLRALILLDDDIDYDTSSNNNNNDNRSNNNDNNDNTHNHKNDNISPTREESKSLIKHMKISYNLKGSVPSGFKVDSLKIVSAKGLGDNVKPYKGVKYITKTGEFIVR